MGGDCDPTPCAPQPLPRELGSSPTFPWGPPSSARHWPSYLFLWADSCVWAYPLHGIGLGVTLPRSAGTSHQTEASQGWILSSSPHATVSQLWPQAGVVLSPAWGGHSSCQPIVDMNRMTGGGVRGGSRGPEWGLSCRVLHLLHQVQAGSLKPQVWPDPRPLGRCWPPATWLGENSQGGSTWKFQTWGGWQGFVTARTIGPQGPLGM